MARFIAAFVGGWLLLMAGAVPARAADNPASGTWKMSFPLPTPRGTLNMTFLVMLSESDKGWVGDFLGALPQLQVEPTVDKVVVKDDNVSFDIKLGATAFGFDGKIAKDGKKIQGSMAVEAGAMLVELTPSKLKNLSDRFAVAKETLETTSGGQEFFDAAFNVLAQAGAKKMKVEDVRALVDKTAKLAESYGTRWQRTVVLRIASSLADQEAFVPIALEQARQAERMLKPDDDASVQMQVLEALVAILKKTKKLDELKPIEARLTKLEARDYADYAKKSLPFKPDDFKGRKGKSDRVVLVELFTAVDCQPCAAAELAVDALQSTYKPSEVVLLQYHLHFPQGNPLAAQDNMTRAEFAKLQAMPAVFIDGKKGPPVNGAATAAKLKFQLLREEIDERLEKPAGARLKLSATQKGSDIAIKADVSDLADPGEKVVLRFALVEERVRYPGASGLRYHHCVVRALPGGVKGIALTKKTSEQTATVNIDKLREEINKHLDEVDKKVDFANADRPLALKNLRVIAFVQDTDTGDVLQAATAEVEEKKGE